jgi:ubiquinone/menaquinone biosynthesis C-methylase UbiE
MPSPSGLFRAGYGPLESLLFDRVLVNVARALHDHAMTVIAPHVRPGMRMLDVGCGGGQFAIRLTDRFPDVSIVGVDLSPQQIARARRREAPRVDFVEGSALDMPFEAASFDLVYSLGSLKHWPDRDKGLAECARVAKPGARLAILEGDRGARAEDVQRFIATWGLPAPLRPVAAAFFRITVAGQSLDLVDARALLAATQAIEGSVERTPGLPAWILEGVRR